MVKLSKIVKLLLEHLYPKAPDPEPEDGEFVVDGGGKGA